MKETIKEEFKKELCWKDKDGKWFLEGNPNTVPTLIHWWLSKLDQYADTKLQKAIELLTKEKTEFSHAKEMERGFNSALNTAIKLIKQQLSGNETKT